MSRYPIRHCEENYEVIDEAISGVCYYFMRLPRSLRLARNDDLLSMLE
ncbi:hypothetical protein [Rickettsia tamurae]|nr:hypothetical protein [Rickettsia tamurae]